MGRQEILDPRYVYGANPKDVARLGGYLPDDLVFGTEFGPMGLTKHGPWTLTHESFPRPEPIDPSDPANFPLYDAARLRDEYRPLIPAVRPLTSEADVTSHVAELLSGSDQSQRLLDRIISEFTQTLLCKKQFSEQDAATLQSVLSLAEATQGIVGMDFRGVIADLTNKQANVIHEAYRQQAAMLNAFNRSGEDYWNAVDQGALRETHDHRERHEQNSSTRTPGAGGSGRGTYTRTHGEDQIQKYDYEGLAPGVYDEQDMEMTTTIPGGQGQRRFAMAGPGVPQQSLLSRLIGHGQTDMSAEENQWGSRAQVTNAHPGSFVVAGSSSFRIDPGETTFHISRRSGRH